MYDIETSAAARRFFEKADVPLQRRLDRCFERLRQDPRGYNMSKPLRGRRPPQWRYRIGDWRVIYRIDDQRRMVYVLKIHHRRDAYE